MVINPFYLIETEGASPDRDKVSRLLGLPYGMARDKWPRRDGRPLHHLLTLATDKLEMPWDDKAKAVSIFADFDPSAGFTGPPLTDALEVHWLDESDLEQGPAADYPDDYEPWWYDDDPQATAYREGRAVHLRQLDIVAEDTVREVLYGEQDLEDLPESLMELADAHSLAGGFPVWVQADETPLDDSGEPMSHILTLNGYQPLLESSPVGLGMLYLFSDRIGQAVWIAQS